MSFWSGQTLAKRLPNLISDFDPKNIDCAAYTLHVGSEAYVSPTSEAPDPKTKTKIQLKTGEAIAIPAGQFAFLLTKETITVPDTALALVSMKARKKFRGLVNVSGFHVDPGYSDKFIFAVFNASPATIHLAEGEPCFLIWYADLDGPPTEEPSDGSTFVRTKEGFSTIPTDLINPIAGQIQSFEGLLAKIKEGDKQLDERLRVVERDHSLVKWSAGIAVGVVLTALLVPSVRDWVIPNLFPPTENAAPVSPTSPPATTPPPALPQPEPSQKQTPPPPPP